MKVSPRSASPAHSRHLCDPTYHGRARVHIASFSTFGLSIRLLILSFLNVLQAWPVSLARSVPARVHPSPEIGSLQAPSPTTTRPVVVGRPILIFPSLHVMDSSMTLLNAHIQFLVCALSSSVIFVFVHCVSIEFMFYASAVELVHVSQPRRPIGLLLYFASP